ncbi:hypothetical protein Tco_0450128 [Tanacetum coccineum]
MENQIVWEIIEQELIPHEPEKKSTSVLWSFRNPNELSRLLWNKDLFYLKNGNNEAKKNVLSLHNIHATSFLKDGLEKLLTIWVGKVLKKSNLEARLSNWKHIWTKLTYKKIHIKTRTDPEEVYSNLKIVKLMRVKNEDGYRQELIYEICVKRTDGKGSWLSTGIESYRIKINLTALTLIILSIEVLKPDTIITDPFIGIM